MHGSMGTGQLATELLCEHLGFERYDAMDAWVLLILDWGLTIDNIAHAINLIYRIQLCKMSESEAEVQ